MRLLFLIRSLERGGAERQLVELVKRLDRFDVAVVTFYGHGGLARELDGLPHVQVIDLEKRGRWDTLRFGRRLLAAIRAYKPDVIHGYMPGANELAAIVGRAIGCRVVWGVRASNVDLTCYDWTAPALFRAGAWLSRAADLIIVNSQAGKRHHLAHGYAGSRMVVVPNGIDLDRFRRDAVAGARLRSAWGVSAACPLVGVIGRIDPMKDQETFLRAAALLAARRGDMRFAIVGHGPAQRTRSLHDLARALAIAGRIVWTGDADDVAAVYNALDLVTSCSAFGEGFSNVLGEAMACERLCVTTDVGDAAQIVGDAGLVIPPRDPDALCAAWNRLLDLSDGDRSFMERLARRRIEDEYNVDALVTRTESALRRLDTGPFAAVTAS